jgi:diguanylate cyclase (GGDEF)-like protein/PAS domain S-box-containing protein
MLIRLSSTGATDLGRSMPENGSSNPTLLSDVEALKGIIDAVPHPIFVKDKESRFVIVNETMCSLMGRSYGELIGQTDHGLMPKDQADIYRENDRRVLKDGITNENEEPFTDRSGCLRTIVTRKNRYVTAEGAAFVIECITDISDFRRVEASIRHHAEHDCLTGVANRSLFERKLEEVVSAKPEPGRPPGLLLIELDGFKEVNDVLGHGAGDNILVQTANVLSELAGTADDVARLGGDEFAMVQRAAPQPETVIRLARTILERLSRPTYVGRRRVAVSASVGIALISDATPDAETFLLHADAALHTAKREGRNRWRLFDQAVAAA